MLKRTYMSYPELGISLDTYQKLLEVKDYLATTKFRRPTPFVGVLLPFSFPFFFWRAFRPVFSMRHWKTCIIGHAGIDWNRLSATEQYFLRPLVVPRNMRKITAKQASQAVENFLTYGHPKYHSITGKH